MRNHRYIMQDQVKDRVHSIMDHNPRDPHGRWRDGPRDLLLTVVMTGLYALVLAATA